MYNYLKKTARWLGVKAKDGISYQVAFWKLISEYGDLISVVAGGEHITLELVKIDGGIPLYYGSAPLEKELAERIAGVPLPRAKAYFLSVGNGIFIEQVGRDNCVSDDPFVVNYKDVVLQNERPSRCLKLKV